METMNLNLVLKEFLKKVIYLREQKKG